MSIEIFKVLEATDSSESILRPSSERGRGRFYRGRSGSRRSRRMMPNLPGLAAPNFRLRFSSNDI